MVDFKKLNKDAKATEYRIEPLVKMLRSEAISDGGTEKKAAALEGKWIKLNEYEYVLEEEGKVTRVYIDTDAVGCACGRCNDRLLCEHTLAFEALESPPQLTIESGDCRWLRTYLLSLGWYSENRYVYPPLGEGLPEDEASWAPDGEEPIKLDPVNEDKELDIGVDEEPEPKTYSRKCVHCGDVISGTDLAQVKQDIAEHTRDCPKNHANKKRPQANDVTVDETDVPKQAVEETVAPKKPPSKKTISLYDWVENLIEFGVGQIFGESGDGKTALCRELAIQAADEGKKVVYWDTEGNMTRKQRAAMTEHKNIEYILDRDWEEIRHMLPVTGEDDRTGPSIYAKTPKLKKCDLFILDSIGVPVLGIFGDMKQNEKGSALQGMQGLVYRLTAWAEKNEAVVIVTNQPVSEMGKTKAQIADRPPFGDKMKYFTKEILKMVTAKRTDYGTVCNLITWRTRDDKRGKVIATVTISDKGVEVTPTRGD